MLACLQLPHAQAVDAGPCEREHKAAEGIEPERLVEVRADGKLHDGSRFVPHAVVIAGDHAETVIASMDIRKVGDAALSRLRPPVLQSLKHIAESYFFGGEQARGRVPKLKIVLV